MTSGFEICETPIFQFCLADGATKEYLPKQGEDMATGYDVRAFIPHALVLNAGDKAIIPLGLRCFSPQGWWLALESRSSTFAKFDLLSLDGIIDTAYEGSIGFVCRYFPTPGGSLTMTIAPGQRLGQLVPFRRQEMLVESISQEEFDFLCLTRGGTRGAGRRH
jgi:dUTPase